MPNRAELYIHSPSRAKYTPSSPSRSLFMSLIQSSQFRTLAMPLNLPVETYRLPGQPATYDAGTTGQRFEDKVLINRISDINFGDVGYIKRITDQYTHQYTELKAGRSNPPLTAAEIELLPPFADMFLLPDVEFFSDYNYMVPDEIENVQQQYIWWSTGDKEDNTFLGLPYLPFISNCKGTDNHISISKIFEDNPQCLNIKYDQTLPVNPYFWVGQVIFF